MADRRKSGKGAARTGNEGLKKALDKKAQRVALEARFWAKVAKSGEDECWIWQGAPDQGSCGYGRFTFLGKRDYAHRWAFKLHYGYLPARAYVQHRCDSPLCCRPDHLKPGLPHDNSADMLSKQRGRRPLKPAQVQVLDRLQREDPATWTVEKLAARFDRSIASVRRILTGVTWSALTGRQPGKPGHRRTLPKITQSQELIHVG